MPDAYDFAAALRVLAGMEPPKRPAGFVEECPRYPAEDGPGAGVRVELTVRVLVGSERSTVIVADPLTGRALAHEALPHGGESDLAAAAVEAAIRARLPSAPGGVSGGLREPAGEPIEQGGRGGGAGHASTVSWISTTSGSNRLG